MTRQTATVDGTAEPDAGPPGSRVRLDKETSRDIGVRWVGMSVALLILYLAAPDRFDGAVLVMVAVLGLALDLRSPLCLRNYFLLYTGGLLLLGGLLYPDLPSYPIDGTLYMATFLLGYASYRWSLRRRDPVNRVGNDLSGPIGGSLEVLVWITVALQVVRVAVLIRQYGIRGFFSGAELVSRFQSFTESNSTVGVIIHIALTALLAATAAVYFEHCLQTGHTPRFRLLVLTLIVLPTISLQRFSLILNCFLLISFYACYRRGPGRSAQPRSTLRRFLPAVSMVLVAVAVAVLIGQIRAKGLVEGGTQTAPENTLAVVVKSEFTPVLFYKNAKENIDLLGYRYGGNIVGALVTRLVPRSIWADKPVTTAEFYARVLAPDLLERGFVLAPSIFGVAFLNFGLTGTALLMLVLGVGAAYFDRGYVSRLYRRMPAFLLVATWAFSLLRDDLATSLVSVLLTFGIYKFFRTFFVRLSSRYSVAGPSPSSRPAVEAGGR
ncbi:MAG TPA: oligosaccharide repeat unit polymerase [Actinomycetota bacterium]|nr:oligosaccharide repeat unit polymerase [Actinomycetota bacterium]